MQNRDLYEFEKFSFDAERQKLMRNGETVSLPPKAAELLLLLIEHQGQVVEKEFLMSSLWQDTFVEEANLTQNIYLLRKTLGKTEDGEPMIKTLPKRGYSFLPEVKIIDAPPNALVVSKFTKIRARFTEEEIEDKTETNFENLALPEKPTAPKPKFLTYKTALIASVFIISLVSAFGIYYLSAARQPAEINSIAVVPFKTIGVGSEEEFWGLGMSEAVVTRLGKTGKIKVSPSDAVRRYAAKEADVFANALSLGAESVLTGLIQRGNERVRVSVQLFRVSDRQIVWSESFDEKISDVFTIQDSISQNLATALTLKLSGEAREELAKRQTQNAEAYELFLKGRYYFARRTSEWVKKAISCFEEAVRLDPNYAQAYAGLADAYAVTVSRIPPQERFPKAKAAAERALRLDPNLAEAHTSLAFILYKSELNWTQAEKHFRRAAEINPNYSQAHHWFGEMLGLSGRFDEGLEKFDKAEGLDPLSPAIKKDRAEILYRARRYDEAIAQARRALELDPNFRNAYTVLADCYEMKKMSAETVEADLKTLELAKYATADIEKLRRTFADSGWQEYWRSQLQIQDKQNQIEYVSTLYFIKIYLRLGENKKALDLLEKSFAERDNAILQLRTAPFFDPLRSETRFQQLMQNAGL